VKTGEYVRYIRERRGYESQQVARMLHLSPSCISRWESGERMIPCEVLPELARCLGCPDLLEKRLQECPVAVARARFARKEAA